MGGKEGKIRRNKRGVQHEKGKGRRNGREGRMKEERNKKRYNMKREKGRRNGRKEG